MKKYQGISVSPGLVLGQVSLLKRETYLFNRSQHSPEKEELVLEEAVRIAQNELDSMAGRSAVSEQAIFTFQSMLLEDDTFMGEVRSYIQAGTGAAEAMNRVGQRYADKLLAMTDNAYLQLRNVDILDVTQRVVNILAGRPRVLLTLDHPVILAADKLMPSDLFSIPSGMILGIITSEGSSLSHAAIIARARGIPSIIQVGRDFLDDCDGRIVVLDADTGSCILDPDADTRQQTVSRICSRQQAEEDVLETPVRTMPCRTRDGAGFELLANCFGPEDIGIALKLGAAGVGLLRSDYQILAGNAFDEQEQYYYYAACIAAAGGKPITVRTFDFGSDRTLSNVYKGDQSAHLGMRGIRSSLRQPRRFENQIRALLRAGTIGPLRIVFPMVTSVVDWDDAMQLVGHCRSNLEERGVPYKADVPFGIMLSIPAACLTAEDFVKHGCEFFVIGTNDLTQYTCALDRQNAKLEPFANPHHPAVLREIKMTIDAGHRHGIWVGICGELGADESLVETFLRMGVDELSVNPKSVLPLRKKIRSLDLSKPAAAVEGDEPDASKAKAEDKAKAKKADKTEKAKA